MKLFFTCSILIFLVISCQTSIRETPPPHTYTGDKPRIQDPLSPEQSQKHIQLPKGFTAELYASEPNIINPIAMTWDERGRLWVVQSMDYPHGLENEVGGDRITICEDTNKDGKADKFIDFATEQSLTTGIIKVKEGVIVAQAPDMVLLHDTNGDDVMDKREILFSGFGTWDTHAGPANLKYGYDNWIWGSVGYSGFENKFGEKNVEFTRGVYKFTRDGADFESVGQFNNNTWGLGFSRDFEIFGSTANNNHACYVGIPLRYYEYLGKRPQWAINSDFIQGHYEIHPVDTVPLQQVDVRGGYTAATGANFYLANNYPKQYQNQMYVNAPTGHLVHIAKIEQEGAGFKEKDGGNIFASTDAWTAPVFTETGPDGNLWVADWYNPVLQHNPDARGMDNQIWNDNKGKGNAHLNENRDKRHGRIYIIKHRKGKSSPINELNAKDSQGLLKALQSDNIFWRTTAQRIIVENQKVDLRAALLDLAKRKENKNSGIAAHALFALDGLAKIDIKDKAAIEALKYVLKNGSIASRTAAIDLIPITEVGSEILVESGLLQEDYLPLKKKAILKASDLPETSSLYAAIEKVISENENDKWISAALKVYLKEQDVDYIKEDEVDMLVSSAEEGKIKWKYTTTDPGEGWAAIDFDDSQWKLGEGAIGTASLNKSILTEVDSKDIWVRRMVKIEGNLDDPVLKVLHDEDYEIFVNGELVAKDHGYTKDHVLVKLEKATSRYFNIGKNLIAGHCVNTSGAQAIDFGFGTIKGFQADKIFNLNTVAQKMAYDQTKLYAMAGQKIELRLNNLDEMPHNLVLIQKGSLEAFGKIVDDFLKDDKAAEHQYIPKSRYVLGATNMLEPQEKGVIRLTLPQEPGVYPFICTFPGHWRVMQGELIVSPRGSYISSNPDANVIAVMGGGGSHNFQEYFGVWDGEVMHKGGRNTILYTEDADELEKTINGASLLVISNNKAFTESAKKAIWEHVNSGRPMLIYHPSTWYNWKDWPEYNKILVGGGSKSHEKLQEFVVEVVKPNHLIMRGVPRKFRIIDELYRWEKDPSGAKIEVLAVGRGIESGEEFPVVWTVRHPKAKIVGNTLGHDEDAHDLSAYKMILENSIDWLMPDAESRNLN